jgi:hypothetical protein
MCIMNKLVALSMGAAAFVLAGAAHADTYSVNANLENWGATGGGDGNAVTPTLVFDHTFALGQVASIDSVTVTLAHSFLSDVRMTLMAPNGDLFVIAVGDGPVGSPFQAGGDSSLLGDGGSLLAGVASYTFVPSGGGIWNGAGNPVAGGDHNAVTWQTGPWVAGNWTFQLLDVWDTLDDGALGSVSIEYTLVPAPGALALIGLAGLASRRRRRA